MNFRQYTNLTKIEIPERVRLVTDEGDMLTNMKNLIDVSLMCDMNHGSNQ